jgi:16S rRNA (cytidine1402-2'-O)-methyltransferase
LALTLVATPIGNIDDISKRALDTLTECEILIGEERVEAERFLAKIGQRGKELHLLNEHSTPKEIEDLAKLCAQKKVALITDCGTPGFCDPGAHLIKVCRQKKIAVHSVPGASSLMMLLSLSSVRLDQFLFRGFLPSETQQRTQALQKLQKETQAFILMDTPYRLNKLLQELAQSFPQKKALLALNLTQETESHHEGLIKDLAQQKFEKSEFMILIYPGNNKT